MDESTGFHGVAAASFDRRPDANLVSLFSSEAGNRWPITPGVTPLHAIDPATHVQSAERTGDVLWENGAPTEYGIEVFTAGDCWALAWYVAHMTGGRLVTLDWPDWRHVAVRLDRHDRNLYLDAHGLHTRADLTKGWGLPVKPLNMAFIETFQDYEDVLDAGFCYPVTHGDVADFAHLLTTRHLPAVTATNTEDAA